MSGFNLDDYVAVNERIAQFHEKYPEGSISSSIHTLTDTLVVVQAFVFRSPTDTLPFMGHSMMKIPGATGFTKGSEVENAETSAWGRALAAAGFEVKRGIASREEVANKVARPDEDDDGGPLGIVPPPVATAPTDTRSVVKRTPHVAKVDHSSHDGRDHGTEPTQPDNDEWEGFGAS